MQIATFATVARTVGAPMRPGLIGQLAPDLIGLLAVIDPPAGFTASIALICIVKFEIFAPTKSAITWSAIPPASCCSMIIVAAVRLHHFAPFFSGEMQP